MGICWGSPSDDQTPRTTGQLSSSVGTSQTTSNTTSSDGSTISGNSHFSAASGHDEPDANGQILPNPNLRIFSFLELKNATRNFRSDTVLGEGGFGKVYKGWLDEKVASKNGSGTVVAVKKLNSESMQGFEEWQGLMDASGQAKGSPEVNFLGRLSHPNLVKLLGYCWEDKELLLVYEFMQKGSLENHLFGRGSAVQPLPWDIRLRILIGAARGLEFLHTSEKHVIYRDFKASNILLDGVLTPHSLIPQVNTPRPGFSSPCTFADLEFLYHHMYEPPLDLEGHLYVKSDVYGFGVVLVEMLSGLRALDTSRPSGKHNLADWVKPYLSERRKLKNIMDSRLEGKYPSKAALQIAQLALKCLGPEPKTRPSMKEVVETLKRIDASNEKPKEPRISSTRRAGYQRGQKPLHNRSPLLPQHNETQSYQLPQRAW
ncbi:protein kinase superfamily protein [Actinidia rufa]|uniref:non-specific serine/threonine protein kinase n=1 Tax=Actinidia rufa TaxID=165716 RepID=A0A7J0DMS4_9ERIC|nr:protein kinase superfamily protein [Actinidia rufa]